MLFFDFATDYALKHPSIAPVKDFKLTDQDFEDFKVFVKSKNFTYDKQSEKILKNLKEVAKFEGYLDDATEEFNALEKKLNHNLDKDLNISRSDIEELLSLEIVKRYYYQKGEIIQSLKTDDDSKKAIEILSNQTKYKNILNPVAKETISKKK